MATFTLTADNGAVIAQGADLRALKFSIECWYPLGAVTYAFDEYGDGWAYAESKRLGYIERKEDAAR